MVFSRRTPSNLEPNRLTRMVQELRAAGRPLIDLTESNPTRAGFEYPSDLLTPLADRLSLVYSPSPFGSEDARSAIARDYERRGVRMSPERIALVSSTSEAYSLLFKILCDPGDEVLYPRPSYPLFEHLTRLDAVNAIPYDLEYHAQWSIDLASIERALSPHTRAILVVSPNNPTGSFVSSSELAAIVSLCAARQISVIADEVFADYELVPGAARRAGQVLGQTETLAFSLGGLSKSIGLPQVKLAWIAVEGPESLVIEALSRLELACDTYLSVSTPVQRASSQLLARGGDVRSQIRKRVAANFRVFVASAASAPATRALVAEGGWYGVLQVPSLGSEEELVLDLLTRDGVLVHPGYFFDFPREAFLVVSLLVAESEFHEGLARVLRHFDCSEASP